VDPRRGDQMVRGAAALPHATGKAVRVAVFAEGAAAEAAKAAGADIVGGERGSMFFWGVGGWGSGGRCLGWGVCADIVGGERGLMFGGWGCGG